MYFAVDLQMPPASTRDHQAEYHGVAGSCDRGGYRSCIRIAGIIGSLIKPPSASLASRAECILTAGG